MLEMYVGVKRAAVEWMPLTQVGVFRMLVDICPREGAQRVDLESFAAGRIKHAADQRRADAAPLELLGNLGVEHRQYPVGALVIGEGNMAIGFEFKAVTLSIVADRIGHVMVSAHS
jgi:hypothetical protein